jgi:hypothetical protein
MRALPFGVRESQLWMGHRRSDATAHRFEGTVLAALAAKCDGEGFANCRSKPVRSRRATISLG